MAKIDRYNGNLKAFASEALGTERTVFGGTAQSDVLDANITLDLLRGWGIVGVNENPTKQDFNGLAFTLGQLIAYLHQQGVPQWNASQEYYQGSVVTTLAGVYRLKAGGVGSADPDTDGGVNWELAPTRAQVDDKADKATTYTRVVADDLLSAKADQTEVDALTASLSHEVGEVILFAGTSAALNTKYSQGWRIADGTDFTPDLIDSFPKLGTFAQKSGTGGAKTVTPAGSVAVAVANHTLSIAEMPIHSHSQTANTSTADYGSNNNGRLNSPSSTKPTGEAGSSNPHNHAGSGTFSGTGHTNEPQFTYLVPLYFTGVAGTYP